MLRDDDCNVSEETMRRMVEQFTISITGKMYEANSVEFTPHGIQCKVMQPTTATASREAIFDVIASLPVVPSIICTTHTIWGRINQDLGIDGIKTEIDGYTPDAVRLSADPFSGMQVRLFDVMSEAREAACKLGDRATLIDHYRTKDGNEIQDRT